MSLVPAFEIGVWNAWILTVIFLLLVFIPIQTLKDFKKKMGSGDEYGKSGAFMTILFFILIACAIFMPLKLGTAWFYTGLSVYLLGLAISIIAIVNAVSTPLGKPFTKGVYRYSRHPMDLSMIIIFVSIGVASASWFYLLLSAISIVLISFAVAGEEHYCLERYGSAYREYINRTPKWLGIPKIVKSK
jgi:protein-S-isoprenylcysteine O-methyltransferase Ste14